MLLARWNRIILCGCLLAAALAPRPAQAELIPVADAPASLMVHGIPLPPGAEPFLAANLSFNNLRSLAPDSGALGKGWLRAVAYHIQPAVMPDEIAAYYLRSLPGTARVRPDVPRRDVRPAPDDGTRVLRFERTERYLAIRTQPSGRTLVTVALYQGSAAPNAVLGAVDELRRAGTEPAPRDLPKEPPKLLNPEKPEIFTQFVGRSLQILQQKLGQGGAPDPVLDVMRTVLPRAQMLRLQRHRVSRLVPATEMLEACRLEARQRRWQLFSVEAEGTAQVQALYRYPEDRGVVMLRAQQGTAAAAKPPAAGSRAADSDTTEINRLELEGGFNLQSLFRPAQLRTPNLIAPPRPGASLRRAPVPPVPGGPIKAQPR